MLVVLPFQGCVRASLFLSEFLNEFVSASESKGLVLFNDTLNHCIKGHVIPVY